MKVFLSYSHRNEDALERLRVHLAVLQQERQLDIWFDNKILAGTEIDREISDKLESADLILLLVSPDFLASPYCTSNEMKRALERHKSKDARVIPIILEPCDWISTSLRKLKALPKDGRPVSDWKNEDHAFSEVVQELRRSLVPGNVRSASQEKSTGIAEGGRHREPTCKTDYHVKREFNDIEVSSFRDTTFGIIRDYFEQSAADIVNLADVHGRFVVRSSTCFVCTVINSALTHGTAHITVYSGDENRGLGDIYFSFKENASPNEANGSFSIHADDYELFLNSLWDSGTRNSKLTPEMVAKHLWNRFIEKAGITKS